MLVHTFGQQGAIVRTEGMATAFMRAAIRRIVGGEYPVSSLIPTESELGAEFGVSRTVIREGTKVLSDKGLLRSQRGRGTEVLPAAQWRAFDSDVLAARLEVGDRDVVLREVLILRRCIEQEIAASAARSNDVEARARLKDCFARLEAARNDPERYKVIDDEFHRKLGELGGIALLGDVLAVLGLPIRIQRDLTGRIPGGNPNMSHEQHDAVYQAVMNRDAAAARAAMEHHLSWAEDRLDHVLVDSPAKAGSLRRSRSPSGPGRV